MAVPHIKIMLLLLYLSITYFIGFQNVTIHFIPYLIPADNYSFPYVYHHKCYLGNSVTMAGVGTSVVLYCSVQGHMTSYFLVCIELVCRKPWSYHHTCFACHMSQSKITLAMQPYRVTLSCNPQIVWIVSYQLMEKSVELSMQIFSYCSFLGKESWYTALFR